MPGKKEEKPKIKETVKETEDDIKSEEESDTLERCKSGNYIKIQVKPLLGGHTYEIEVSETITIGELKGVLEVQYGIDTSHAVLVHHGEQLSDYRTVESSGLINNSTIYMMPKMRSGPLNYRVNTRAVQNYMNEVDKEIKDAMVTIGDETGYPVKDDDVFMVSMDDKGDLKIVRITNSDKPIKKEEEHDPKNDEINVETWDKMGENQQTRSKMAELQKKMKASKEEKTRKREVRSKIHGEKKVEQGKVVVDKVQNGKIKMAADTMSLEKTGTANSSISSKEEPVIKIKKIRPPTSNVITDFKKQSKMSENWNDPALWSTSAEEEPSAKLDIPQTNKGDKRYPAMEDYPAKKPEPSKKLKH